MLTQPLDSTAGEIEPRLHNRHCFVDQWLDRRWGGSVEMHMVDMGSPLGVDYVDNHFSLLEKLDEPAAGMASCKPVVPSGSWMDAG